MSQSVAAAQPPTFAAKATTLFIVVAPLVCIFGFLVWNVFDVPAAKIQAIVWYIATVLGITVSFHRELTHKALRLVPWARNTMAGIGSLSVEGPPIEWVYKHRKHHRHTDQLGDPHSPGEYGDDVIGVLKGLVHAHIGWFFKKSEPPNYEKYTRDILEDRGIMFVNKMFPVLAVSTFVLPGLITLFFETSWYGFFAGVFWAFVRVGLVHHATWSINSICHKWGTKPFRSEDRSTNNAALAPFTAGEAWHENHHVFPKSARIGLRWWQIDWGWIFIQILRFFRLVKWVKVPSKEQIQARMKKAA